MIFVAIWRSDIKTVSDEGLEIKNPIDEFIRRLNDELLKRTLIGRWNYRVGGTSDEAKITGDMVGLKLPALFRFDIEIFNESFFTFLDKVGRLPHSSHELTINNGTTDIEISYTPGGEGWISGNHPSFKQITLREHLTKNSVYNGLESKSHQLKESQFDGTKGIIICDGGSSFVKSRNIYDEFLRTHPIIDFVLAFGVEQTFGVNAFAQVKIYFVEGSNLNPKLRTFLDSLHEQDVFPYPRRNAVNAKIENRQKEYLSKGWGYTVIKGNEITISSRTALELLSGHVPETLSKEHKEFFDRMKNEGRLIVETSFQKGEEEIDDHHITLRFGERDAAISPFHMPTPVSTKLN